MRRIKTPWQQLVSGLYVPPLLKFAPGYPCCCEEEETEFPCSRCEDGNGPNDVQVDISGVTDGVGCEAGDCDTFYNGTFILSAVLTCRWDNQEDMLCSGTLRSEVGFNLTLNQIGDDVILELTVFQPQIGLNDRTVHMEKIFPDVSVVDCNFDEEVLSLIDDADPCIFLNATVTVTAL